MERRRSPLVSIPPLGRGFTRHRYDYQAIPSAWLRPGRACFRFTRQDHCSSTTSIRLNFRVARHSGGIGGIRFGFLSRLLIYAECLLGLGFDRGETLAVAISPERMWAYNTRFCRKPDNPVFQ